MAKKRKSHQQIVKRSAKKGARRIARKRQLTIKERSEVERLINAPRVAHQKHERLAYDEFHDLEFQRLAIAEELKKSLNNNTINQFEIKNWVRCVSYQFSNQPLSSRGSIKSIGGRFNIGEDISEDNCTPFNALYIAGDQITALMEKFGVTKEEDLEKAMEACFEKKENTVSVHISAMLHNILDLDNKITLKEFAKLISTFKKSHEIIARRKALGLEVGDVIKDARSLKTSLYDPEWRYTPQVYDLPSNSQIFGQIAYRAGVEAIMYTSVKNKKKCLAIFPRNLSHKSFVEISGKYPETVKHIRMDSSNYKELL